MGTSPREQGYFRPFLQRIHKVWTAHWSARLRSSRVFKRALPIAALVIGISGVLLVCVLVAMQAPKNARLDNTGDDKQANPRDPQNAAAGGNRRVAPPVIRDAEKTVADYNGLIRLNPDGAAPYCSRGNLWSATGEYANAMSDYKQAIRLAPKFALPYNRLAWLQATCPNPRYRDGSEAVENARQACELSQYQNAFHVTVLAAAYAEAGNFDEAFNRIEQAIQMDATSTREAMRDLFQNNEPYRDDPTRSLE